MAAKKIYPEIAAGNRFGRLTIVVEADPYIWNGRVHGRRWACLCSCGVRAEVRECHLVTGRIVSCGCHASEMAGNRTRTHCGTVGGRSAEFNVWCLMRGRCDNPKNGKYADYGGRGIRVCGRWLGDGGFANFIADMGPRPSSKHSIERRYNDGPYDPANCHWALAHEQSRNRRTNRWIEFGGRRKCLTDWAAEIGISHHGLQHRLNAGWSLERALRR